MGVNESLFSADYQSSRARFREAARAAGARLHSVPLSARGPQGEDLSIDVAWLGAERPRAVTLHCSGTHGVEGFCGAPIQLQALQRAPSPPPDGAVIFAHGLNPYGMAHVRRVNEENVDLNRNFLLPGEAYSGAPEAYGEFDSLLNPPTPPGLDLFAPKMLLLLAKHGMPMLKQVIVGGQYDFPKGLFYGGARLQEGPRLWTEWIRAHLGEVERLVCIDIHSGLGEFGEDTLLVEAEIGSAHFDRLRDTFGERITPWNPNDGVAYAIRGGYPSWLPAQLPNARVDFITQEFGTTIPLRTLYAMREENRLHHWGEPTPAHDVKQRFRESFCPSSPAWRNAVLRRGGELLSQALGLTFNEGNRP
jgi:hypothetical protein